MINFIKNKSLWIIGILITFIICMHIYYSNVVNENGKLIDEIEYKDSLGKYNKIYYEKKFSDLKNENKQLYDSLKHYKDEIDFIIQFTHEQDHNTGQVHDKPNIVDSVVYDTIKVNETLMAKTYQYTSEPNDTFQYKLNINSYTEPKWYELSIHTKNQFTIVNKEENGTNHITIDPHNNGTINDVTVFKQEKKKFWDRFSFGPGATLGYDPIRKEWGVTVGITCTFNLK